MRPPSRALPAHRRRGRATCESPRGSAPGRTRQGRRRRSGRPRGGGTRARSRRRSCRRRRAAPRGARRSRPRVAVTTSPSAVTRSAEIRLSHANPCLRSSQPLPLPSVKPDEAGRRHAAAGRREAERLRLLVELAPVDARLGPRGPLLRVDADALHPAHVDARSRRRSSRSRRRSGRRRGLRAAVRSAVRGRSRGSCPPCRPDAELPRACDRTSR